MKFLHSEDDWVSGLPLSKDPADFSTAEGPVPRASAADLQSR